MKQEFKKGDAVIYRYKGFDYIGKYVKLEPRYYHIISFAGNDIYVCLTTKNLKKLTIIK